MVAIIHPNGHGSRFARSLERRSALAANGLSAEYEARSIDDEPGISTRVPKSTIALAVVLSLVCLTLIAVFAMSVYRSRNRNNEKTSQVSEGKPASQPEKLSKELYVELYKESFEVGKPPQAVLPLPVPSDTHAGWVPEIRTHYGIPVAPQAAQGLKNPKKVPSRLWGEKHLSSVKSEVSPPPSYIIMSDVAELTPVQADTPIPTITVESVSPHTSPSLSPSKPSLGSRFSTETEIGPLVSPARSESFTPHTIAFALSPNIDGNSPSIPSNGTATLDLPRYMSVKVAFSPTLDDELAVDIGDIVCMLGEFRDGWCLIQRIGPPDAPKGVCPRFCLKEREGAGVPSPRKSTSSRSLKDA